MAELFSFFNSKDHDRKYNAKHWADYFYPLFKSGVFNGGLQVIANRNMSVTIKKGYAWIDGYAYHLTEDLIVDIETASGNMNREDIIVVRLDLSNRYVKSFGVTGAYANNPEPPEPTRSETIQEYQLCIVSVPTGTTAITQTLITDTRMNSDVCGWVCGAVEQIDFSQITAQFERFFADYEADIQAQYNLYLQDVARLESEGQQAYNEMCRQFDTYATTQQTEFEAWVNTIRNILDETVAGNLLLLIEQKMQKVTISVVNGVTNLVEEEGLYLAINGFNWQETVINPDKSMTVTDNEGRKKEVVFEGKNKIFEYLYINNVLRYTHTVLFEKNMITERIIAHE